MATISLDDIRESVEREFVSTKITIGDTDVLMVNPLRLDRKSRAALSDGLKAFGKKDEQAGFDEQFDGMLGIIKTAVPDRTQANLLLAAIGDDMALAVKILEAYMEEQKPGEASGSQD